MAQNMELSQNGNCVIGELMDWVHELSEAIATCDNNEILNTEVRCVFAG